MSEELHIVCEGCSASISLEARFCPHCGARRRKNYSLEKGVYQDRFISILVFFILMAIICLSSGFIDFFKFLPNRFYVYGALSLVIVLFFIPNYKYVIPLFSFRRVSLKRIAWIVPLTICCSVAINYLADEFNWHVMHVTHSFVSEFLFYKPIWLWMLLFDALHPALFEELAFRGVLFNQLKSFLRPEQIIWVTSILFATIHFTALSAVWILPFGLVVARLRWKYQTLWYGIIIHFVFNATASMIDYAQFQGFLPSFVG